MVIYSEHSVFVNSGDVDRKESRREGRRRRRGIEKREKRKTGK